MGRKAGLTDEKLLALADYETSPELTDLEKLAIRYAVEMTRTPVEVPDELFSRLREHFNDQQIVELTSAIAWENYRARNNMRWAWSPRVSPRARFVRCHRDPSDHRHPNSANWRRAILFQ